VQNTSHGQAHVFRHESTLGRWTVTTLDVHPLLHGIVRQIWHGEGKVAYARDRILPSAQSTMLINLGPPHVVIDGRDPGSRSFEGAWFAGLSERPIDAEMPHGSCVLGIAFTATGAARLLPWAQSEVANTIGPLVEGPGKEVARLRERLLEEPDAIARLELAQKWLLGACVSGRDIHPLVHWAHRRLAASGGTIRTETLSREAGYSRKYLHELFRRQVGLPPKALARVLRFQRTLRRIRQIPDGSWSDVAAICGYADQSHLIRDFREFSGMSPGAFARLAAPDPGSVVVR